MADLGEELIRFWGGGAKASYTRTGWLAQFKQLTGTKAGHAALERAGLSATVDTQRAWLAEQRDANAENQRIIHRAYQAFANRWNPANETRRIAVFGWIDSGDREEERTLRLGLGDWDSVVWTRLESLYNAGIPTDPDKRRDYFDSIVDAFIEDVVEQDIGQTSGEWDFPGTSYDVTEF